MCYNCHMKKPIFIVIATCMLLCGCFAEQPMQPAVEVPANNATAVVPNIPPQLPSCCEVWNEEESEAWVVFVNAKKGDAALVCADGKYYLIDTGRKENAQRLVGIMKELGVDSLEGVFLTHSHDDHTGGLKTVAEAFPIAQAYRGEFAETNKKGEVKLDNKLEKAELEPTVLCAGDKIETESATFTVLAPLQLNIADDNDNSLVLMLETGGVKLLFAGDTQFAQEHTLLQKGVDLKADILKVGNHGNKDATSDAFAAAVSPQAAIISTNTLFDDNSANARVISALKGADVFVTQDYAWGIKVTVKQSAFTVGAAEPDINNERRKEFMRTDYHTMLVNRQNLIAADYVPANLAKAEDMGLENIKLDKKSMQCDEEALLALKQMMLAAKADGVTGFLFVSGYRDYEYQQGLWNKKLARDPNYGKDPTAPISVAYPGASEHQTGLAFDISSVEKPSLDAEFSSTPQGKWLYENCARFGFILRFPKGKENVTAIVFEPWHFRYVGKELAAHLTENGLTMEEYYSPQM